ncbi:MAG: Asp-tRNA(Asn)/Glu-tRNA(Gln) amidotransferase subunit GatC [Bacteroidia bacterium]|nr:Asp-tRNA(Asn)/Glu-tRNA(Gln) amidotransferase subunit GatC [Bacteroidia bacterium]
MEINDALIDHIASLARLGFNGEEKEEIKKDFSRMIAFVDKLRELNVEGIEPLIYLNERKCFWREDVPGEELSRNDALKNSPSKDSDYFLVPKVLEK